MNVFIVTALKTVGQNLKSSPRDPPALSHTDKSICSLMSSDRKSSANWQRHGFLFQASAVFAGPPPCPSVDFILVGSLISIWHETHNSCVICKRDDHVCGVSRCGVPGKERVQNRAEHTPLRCSCAKCQVWGGVRNESHCLWEIGPAWSTGSDVCEDPCPVASWLVSHGQLCWSRAKVHEQQPQICPLPLQVRLCNVLEWCLKRPLWIHLLCRRIGAGPRRESCLHMP